MAGAAWVVWFSDASAESAQLVRVDGDGRAQVSSGRAAAADQLPGDQGEHGREQATGSDGQSVGP